MIFFFQHVLPFCISFAAAGSVGVAPILLDWISGDRWVLHSPDRHLLMGCIVLWLVAVLVSVAGLICLAIYVTR